MASHRIRSYNQEIRAASAASAGTVTARDDVSERPTSLSNPGAWGLQKEAPQMCARMSHVLGPFYEGSFSLAASNTAMEAAAFFLGAM